ncbi:hypothetical protein HNR06_004943 [Nocardiopsis arvandica]|uniref:Uncharacterized protein n=1 Tax=Nocardiopsis sinuspersici TaxID=501010 RepID=A0A7Z0BNC5_9ACTN|nr:hypothetical protein [Nocardiopsis sinuspersici]NYH55354.1 hypothetical protein [Nocardiopsis sinuspersici]
MDADDRITHISTVLRYPPAPLWRGEPRSDKRLPFRAEPGLIDRARDVSLRLPGQSQRAHRDYQSRLLTDAVMTAIAAEEPFVDEFLEGMLPLLRHRSALGLWKLAVAMTSTQPELTVRSAAEEERERTREDIALLDAEEFALRDWLLRVAKALEKEVAWHSPDRFQVAANIVRKVLSGDRACINEQALYEQESAWAKLHQNLLDANSGKNYSLAGRGGTAVWRAERKVTVQDFGDWLIERTEAERTMCPPGWLVRSPRKWRARTFFPRALQVLEPYKTWAAEGRLLVFPYKNRQAVWPLTRSAQGRWERVPGIEPIVSAAKGLRPEQLVGFIEAVLIDWNDGYGKNFRFPIELNLPVDKACDLGLITVQERQQAMAEARAQTEQAKKDIIDGLREDQDYFRSALEEVKGDTRWFRLVAERLGIRPWLRVSKATWRWPGRSVVDELLTDAPEDLVEWLAVWAHKNSIRTLGHSMQEAWHEAFDPYRGRM